MRHSASVEETERIAAEVALMMPAGGCIALEGELGAGKTQFARGLVKALGGEGRWVSSPTYVLMNVYPAPMRTVYHLDAYRVSGPEDFEAIGFPELLEQGGLVVVEWASRIAALLPPSTARVAISAVGPGERRIDIEGL